MHKRYAIVKNKALEISRALILGGVIMDDVTMVRKKTLFLTRVSVLSVIAFLLMYLEIALPFFPEFLKIDISNVPVLIGTYAMGPWTGVIILLMKDILHLILKGATMGIGEFADFMIGSSFMLVAGYMYRYKRTLAGALTGMVLATVTMAIVGSLMNYYVLLPLYQKALGFPLKAIIGMGTKVNKHIVDLKSLVVLSILPFNILKGTVVSFITLVLYKKVSPILHD